MWTVSMHVVFTLCGLVPVVMGVRALRHGRRGRHFDDWFTAVLTMLIGSIFVGAGVAALLFGYDLGVPSQRSLVESLLNSLALAAIVLTWRWIRRRRRP